MYGGDDDECSAGYGSDQLCISAHAARPAALNIVSNTSPTDYCSAAAAVSQPPPTACLQPQPHSRPSHQRCSCRRDAQLRVISDAVRIIGADFHVAMVATAPGEELLAQGSTLCWELEPPYDIKLVFDVQEITLIVL